MAIKIDKEELLKTGLSLDPLLSVRRPVGAWRFLTSLDISREGDLYRVAFVNGHKRDRYTIAYESGYTPIPTDIGSLKDAFDRLDIIRPYDETGVSEPLFEN